MRNNSLAICWYDLGVELLPDNIHSLEVIERSHPTDVGTFCRKMFQTWLNTKPDASWHQLVTALGKINMGYAAHCVSTQYMPGMYVIASYHTVICFV